MNILVTLVIYLTYIFISHLKPSPENVEVKPRCRLDDPNLCSKQVPATHQPSKEWIQLRDEFRRLNITFPFNFDVSRDFERLSHTSLERISCLFKGGN